jgi:hypothetical protein
VEVDDPSAGRGVGAAVEVGADDVREQNVGVAGVVVDEPLRLGRVECEA